MKLKEFIQKTIDEDNHLDQFGFKATALYGKKVLEQYKEQILKCEEFKGLTSLEFAEFPAYKDENDEVKTIMTYKLGDNTIFNGKGIILSLSLTPEMFDPNKLTTPVKDGAVITPTFYNHKNFEPYKRIVLEFSPERMQDGISNHEEIVRQELHDLLDKVIDNPQDYTPVGERHVLIRGIFEEVASIQEKNTVDFNLVASTKEDDVFTVFYLESKAEDDQGNINMELKSKWIPTKLKDKFMEELEEKHKNLRLRKEEIDKFLEENK